MGCHPWLLLLKPFRLLWFRDNGPFERTKLSTSITTKTPGLKDLNNNNREWQLTEKLLPTFPTTPDGVEQCCEKQVHFR